MNTATASCRACGGATLVTVLSLGRTPLANALRRDEDLTRPEATYPLDLAFCPICTLVQIRDTVPPEHLFDDYLYFSSFSETMVRHAANLAGRLIRDRELGANHLVVEAASNDGYLLRAYKAAGVPVLGVEPAKNIAVVAEREHGIPTRVAYFHENTAQELVAEGLRADVFHAHNVLAHVPDLNGFVRGIRTLLKDDGVAVIEAPYLKEMLDHREFDTIYHEHVFYFSLTALDRCFRRHGLTIVDVERVAIHGGTLRVFAARSEKASPSESVAQLLAEEAAWGVGTEQPYHEFAQGVRTLRMQLRQMLSNVKAAGHRVAAYGASAKGSTLLNYCGIGAETLDFVVDRSTVKQGRVTPGSGLRIYAPEKLLDAMPEYTLLLTWNFAEEIFRQQAEYRRRGGRFITPVPVPKVA